MPTYVVTRKSDGEVVFRYGADSAIEWSGFEFATHTHVAEPEAPAPQEVVVPAEWHIGVGPFWDRFGAYKIPVLASADAVVQAVVKDCMVRKYLDLKGRRADIEAALNLLVSKGFPLNVSAILDTKPAAEELHRGN